MYEIRLDFIRLQELPVLAAVKRRGVFALWGPMGKGPLLITCGDLIEALADPANRKNNMVTGYYATVEGNRRNPGRDAKLASAVLNYITTERGRPATRGRGAGRLDAVQELAPKRNHVEIVIRGWDPLKPPSTSRALRKNRNIILDGAQLAEGEPGWLHHPWSR